MKGRRFFRPQDSFHRGPRINDHIRKSPVRLINDNDEMVGVVPVAEAQRMAREAGLDLVEISPDSEPPVCRIMDFGKWKYEQAKKDKATRAKAKHSELKEVRLGRSMKIDPHDVEIRLTQARRFLLEGHKVQLVQNFRGREMAHRDRGEQRMQEIIERLADVSKVEMPPRLAGKRLTMILVPDRTKIEQVRRREAAGAGRGTTDGQAQESQRDAHPEDAEPAATLAAPAGG